MPAAKGKGGTMSHRYRPASEYDDAALAQKREYWRNKKREQRARLSERRGKPVQASRGEKLLHVNSSVPSSFKASSSPLQISDDSASHIGSTVADCSLEATENQKEKWLQTMKLNKVLPHLPSLSHSNSAKAAGGDTATAKCATARGAVHRAVTSTPSTSSTVPPVTRITNGSSTKTAPPPCVSMQGASVPKTQQKAQAVSPIQPKLLPSSKTTGGMLLVSSPCGSVSFKTEDTATQKSALVMVQRAKDNAQPSQESEEERAVRRREQWRIKKREQRAKLAARLPKARERTQGAEVMFQRRAGLTGSSVLPSQPFLRGGQKQCVVRVKMPVKRENDKLQNGAANTIIHQIKVQNPYEDKARESQRRFSSFVHLSNVTRGIARCKTPRQRFIEAQKNFLIQRNNRFKSPLMVSVFSSRNIPKINPNDTPEQIIAKRREYWRIKKREQRAKLSMEMKARLKEKDSLMRRVKRYQKILEDMRKARAVNALTHASETIGGFIKEDGTLTVNMPTNQSVAEEKTEGELRVASKSSSTTRSQLQSEKRGVTLLRIQAPPPPLCAAQVKVSFPLAEHSVNKPPRLLSIRPQLQPESTTVPHTHSAGQLTLTHPQTPPNSTPSGSTTGSNLGSCVMKMAVSSGAPSLSALSIGQGLTEEERMAKKREYWRIKKREQRAARAVWLKQGVLQARANTALQKRNTQKQEAKPAMSGHAQPPPSNSSTTPVMPSAKEIKHESESVPAVDLNSQPEQAICPDIKPPTPPPEPDPALSADSQATTLLAVASMKKLLEESLSAVTETADVEVQTSEETSKQCIKSDLPPLFFERDDMAPIAADQTLQIKSRQPDSDVLQADSKTSQLGSSDPSSSEVALIRISEPSSKACSNFTVNPPVESSEGPSSPRRTHRLRPKKPGHQTCCSPDPPKLHHLIAAPPDELQQRPCEQQRCPVPEQLQNSTSASAQRYHSVEMEQSGLTSLQKKREYWKLMKRQQRARLKARLRERQAEGSNRPSARNIQAPGLVIIKTVKAVNTPVLQPKPVTPLAAVSSIPSVLVVTQTCNADTLQVKMPVASREQNNTGPSEIMSNSTVVPEKWTSRTGTDTDSAPSLPTLKPPDNPLSSINLQPIEPPGQSPNSILSPIKIPCTQRQSPTHVLQSSPKLSPMSTMVPPKPIPGESEEDFLKRKREYWRIKKKEQRARKAIRDKGLASRRVSNNWRPILPAQDLQTQDCGQWVNSSEESGQLLSTSMDTNPDSFTYSSYTAPIEDESELIFADYDNNEEEGPISDAVWRNRYLMDYDPLNQLLVCMVCGELQYSHSLEGVRTHIDEAHPHTLTLEPGEKQRILEAWDEQVSQRERFFTSQLQQHSGALAEAHRN
ncbi:uncharacterized protein LOC114450945 [Parambassis ranga]|uniref:Uncharacterized protein LOC114450945 n=1 Tax=Parambassis ranga TaxID=210632 RepID=A0A6P7K7C8_9TELE|nr:uncharacterized protein LOC114450945 [Parambassis ranga]XP_028285208.1 uncharacterized protein LOC114450945 [Parambassis ranga]XP_028285209.1 uncharacterized protein LOC114450945 [Parambassis ranga]